MCIDVAANDADSCEPQTKTVGAGLDANKKIKTDKRREDKDTDERRDVNSKRQRIPREQKRWEKERGYSGSTMGTVWCLKSYTYIKPQTFSDSLKPRSRNFCSRSLVAFTHSTTLNGAVWLLPEACNLYSEQQDNNLCKTGSGVYKVGLQASSSS